MMIIEKNYYSPSAKEDEFKKLRNKWFAILAGAVIFVYAVISIGSYFQLADDDPYVNDFRHQEFLKVSYFCVKQLAGAESDFKLRFQYVDNRKMIVMQMNDSSTLLLDDDYSYINEILLILYNNVIEYERSGQLLIVHDKNGDCIYPEKYYL